MGFKKFDKENENKNKGTDSNALSEDELSNVSGGWNTGLYGHRYAATEEEKEWGKELLSMERAYSEKTVRDFDGLEALNKYIETNPCSSGFRGGNFG